MDEIAKEKVKEFINKEEQIIKDNAEALLIDWLLRKHKTKKPKHDEKKQYYEAGGTQ